MCDVVHGDLEHGRHQPARRSKIVDPPAVHGIGLGEGKHRHGAVLHAVKRCDADMAGAVIDDILIDLVGDHDQVMADRNVRTGSCSSARLVDAPVGLDGLTSTIARVQRTDSSFDRGGGGWCSCPSRRVSLLMQSCARELDLAAVLRVIRFEQYHLVAGIEQRRRKATKAAWVTPLVTSTSAARS